MRIGLAASSLFLAPRVESILESASTHPSPRPVWLKAAKSPTMVTKVLDDFYLGLTAIITVVYQLVFFSIAFGCKFDLLTGE